MSLEQDFNDLATELQISEDALLKLKVVVESFVHDQIEATKAELIKEHEEEIKSLEESYKDTIESLESELVLVQEKAEEYGEFLQEKAEAYGKEIYESTLEDTNKYAEYVIENFISEHKEQFVMESEYSKLKKTVEALKESFQHSLFELEPADTKVIAEMEEAKASYAKLFEDFNSLKSEIVTLKKEKLFEEKTKDFADTQKERAEKLLESLNTKSLDEYTKALDLVVADVSKKTLTEEVITEEKEEKPKKSNEKMASYLKYLS